MDVEAFERSLKSAFSRLEPDFGFRLCAHEPPRHGRFKVTYRNETTFITVTLVASYDRYFNVFVGPLVDGEVPARVVRLEPGQEHVTRYPLWAMAPAKGEDEPPLFPSADGTQVEEQLRAVIAALCDYAADALS